MYQKKYEDKALEVMRSGWYILGKEVESFEKEWAKYIGTKYAVGLASGLDALWISFRLLDIKEGDEVIVCSNAYIACVMVSNWANSLDGLLLNHGKMSVEFQGGDEVVSEVNRLLLDEDYRRNKEAKIAQNVMDENEFREELEKLIEENKTSFIFNIHDIDTKSFQKAYRDRFSIDDLLRLLINKHTVLLWAGYPKLVLYRLIRKVIRLIRG